MHKITKFDFNEIKPSIDEVLQANGYPLDKVPSNIKNLVDKSFILFNKYADPMGIYKKVSIEKFSEILIGQGQNESMIPLQIIYPEADKLIIFALTLGSKISNKIQDLFNENDFALGHMLDCIASIAADKAVRELEDMQETDLVALAYSPGYCGWHISSQQKLFEYLQTDKIGITLNKSFLMIPIKSISGVLVVASKKVHIYENSFTFCSECRSKTCVERIRNLTSGE